jgi:alcohol dehydrogenase
MSDAEKLAGRIESLLDTASIPRRLEELSIRSDQIPELAAMAAKQWTAAFNPRPVDEASFRHIYQKAL